MAVLAIPLGWYTYGYRKRQQRISAMAVICARGGDFVFRLPNGSIGDRDDPKVRRTATVEKIYFANTELNEHVLSMLRHFPEAEFLSFNRTSFSDEHVRFLAHQRQLRNLQLNGTRITHDGIAHIARTHQLQVLTLNDTTIDDRSLAHLAEMTSLDKLKIYGTLASDSGLALLQDSLPKCEIGYQWPPATPANETDVPSDLPGP